MVSNMVVIEANGNSNINSSHVTIQNMYDLCVCVCVPFLLRSVFDQVQGIGFRVRG